MGAGQLEHRLDHADVLGGQADPPEDAPARCGARRPRRGRRSRCAGAPSRSSRACRRVRSRVSSGERVAAPPPGGRRGGSTPARAAPMLDDDQVGGAPSGTRSRRPETGDPAPAGRHRGILRRGRGHGDDEGPSMTPCTTLDGERAPPARPARRARRAPTESSSGSGSRARPASSRTTASTATPYPCPRAPRDGQRADLHLLVEERPELRRPALGQRRPPGVPRRGAHGSRGGRAAPCGAPRAPARAPAPRRRRRATAARSLNLLDKLN